ncbi:hypothetical protein EVAR_51951_1 [Eumeta japonica]|uniref:Uncharacterized protein n=1 Tax=Eumeta variegata TaxID=151549 RepID=A0A4C1Y1P0_EUMVA|nr:hypothetical protein EVAR_51951_1 [Eumeta japonica]
MNNILFSGPHGARVGYGRQPRTPTAVYLFMAPHALSGPFSRFLFSHIKCFVVKLAFPSIHVGLTQHVPYIVAGTFADKTSALTRSAIKQAITALQERRLVQ